MSEKPAIYRDPIPGRGAVELRRSVAGVYSWTITIWADAIVTEAHLLGMVDSAAAVDRELRDRFPEPVEGVKDAKAKS